MGVFAVVYVLYGWVNVRLVVALDVDDAKQLLSDTFAANEITGYVIVSASPLPRGVYSAVESDTPKK